MQARAATVTSLLSEYLIWVDVDMGHAELFVMQKVPGALIKYFTCYKNVWKCAMEHGSKLQLFGVILVREAFISYVSEEIEIFLNENLFETKVDSITFCCYLVYSIILYCLNYSTSRNYLIDPRKLQ